MSAAATVGIGRRTLRIRGTTYPVLLPSLRDSRLHLAAVIVTLQVVGQTAFAFNLSIAQILVALVTCAVLEVAISFGRSKVIMWPASALLTGNGVAFILRVPGTEHGDWWSLRGAWIYAATAAVSLLSKYLIRFRGHHVFNPSNFGLVLCFLILGSGRADPLDFWWGPMSGWLAFALALIVSGGLVILLRLRLLEIAVWFWVAFVGAIAILAASGHALTARWHLGPVSDGYFWRMLAFSPEVLVFLFFMITDPKTVPAGRGARRAYSLGVALLAALLIAPQRTEFGSKVALLGALAIVCAVRPLAEAFLPGSSIVARLAGLVRGRRLGAMAAFAGAAAFVGIMILAGNPARSSASAAIAPIGDATGLPEITVVPSKHVASRIDGPTALRIARDVVLDLRVEADALRLRDPKRAAGAADGPWLASLQQRIETTATGRISLPIYRVDHIRATLQPAKGQGSPIVVTTLAGMSHRTTYSGSPPRVESREEAARFQRVVNLALVGRHFLIVGPQAEAVQASPGVAAAPTERRNLSRAAAAGFAGVRLRNVAAQVGLTFRQGAFRYGVSADTVAMMGGGLCWLDYDNDGWLDLYAVNSYADRDLPQWEQHGGLPRNALFHNVHGRFVDVSKGSGADLAVRGTGCVAADLNGDGRTDLYVTTATNDALLWNEGGGKFVDGATAAGMHSFGWHSGAAVADVNGDGRQDVFVAGYTDPNAPIPGSFGGFPTNHEAVRDLLFLNLGNDRHGRARFREVARQAGIEPHGLDHGLGAVFSDVNGDGHPDLYVANDEDPNRLYVNVPWPGGTNADPAHLGFRFEERGRTEAVADRNAGMGVAAGDYNDDGRPDLFVSNSRQQPHAVFRSRAAQRGLPSFVDGRAAFAAAFGTSFTGWGASWVDLNRDGNLDLVLANGGIPIKSLARDARPIQVLENLTAQGERDRFADATNILGLRGQPRIDGRGLAAADFNNDGTVDVAVNAIGGPLVLLETTSRSGHWLEVSLGGVSPGAVVTAVLPNGRRLVRETHAGSSYLSSEDPRVYFGLGAATKVSRLVVRYPGGEQKQLVGVAADRIVEVTP